MTVHAGVWGWSAEPRCASLVKDKDLPAPVELPGKSFCLYTCVAFGLADVVVALEFELRYRLDVGAVALPCDRSV